MAYTVKQVAEMSGVSVRTLHFYDEIGLLPPAYHGANGYRYYEEPQLLTLQQILFYRELGFELKDVQRILGRADFQQVAALRSHREVLEASLARTRRLLETIDATIGHLEGRTDMTSEQLFGGFSVPAETGRSGERVTLGGEPHDCKVSTQDTGGAMCIFEITGRSAGPRHWHHEQDEWLYVVDGEVECHVGDARYHLRAGESVFVPRKAPHAWASRGGGTARVLNVYQPAGRMEQFFREVGAFTDPPIHEALSIPEMGALFEAHGMKLAGPPLSWPE
jgi:DNA-binding transcriptional MerR regulator/quercetin dioxygenase-like cupin family protein